jgi:hypothetical protein
MKTSLMLCLVLFTLVAFAPAARAETPAGYLQKQVKPVFREGHQLPRLTRFGWTLPEDARIELARHWGYALELGGYTTDKVVAKLDDPDSLESRLIALARSEPETFPLQVILSRDLPTGDVPAVAEPPSVAATAPPREGELAKPDDPIHLDRRGANPAGDPWTRDAQGELVEGKRVWSPEAADDVVQGAADLRSEPLREVARRAPVAIVLNGGEYALGVLGFSKKHWEQDPRIWRPAARRLGSTTFRNAKPRWKCASRGRPRRGARSAVVPVLHVRRRDASQPLGRMEGMGLRLCLDAACVGRADRRVLLPALQQRLGGRHEHVDSSPERQRLRAVVRQAAELQLAVRRLAARQGRRRPGQGPGRPGTLHGVRQVPVHDRHDRSQRRVLRLSTGRIRRRVSRGPAAALAAADDRPGSCSRLFSHLEDDLRNGDLLPGPDRHVWSNRNRPTNCRPGTKRCGSLRANTA